MVGAFDPSGEETLIAGFASRVLLLAVAAQGGDPRLPDWERVPAPEPFSRAWSCANYSDSWYLTDSDGGPLNPVVGPTRRVEDPLPFAIAAAKDRQGDRHVVQVGAGWLVGFDAGEFGGGLWWYERVGAEAVRVRPPTHAPVHPKEYYKADNVQGFARLDGVWLVLIGLDHMGIRSGRAFEVKRAGADVVLAPRGVFDGSPRGWVAYRGTLLVVTDTSLYALAAGQDAKVLHEFAHDLGGLYPTSIVRADDGVLYVGMRRFVVRLAPAGGGRYQEEWWVPRRCLRFHLTDSCQCLPRD